MMEYNFKPELAVKECVDWLKGQSVTAKFNKVVIGISGGKDSTIAAALCCRAFGNNNVHGLLLPNGIQKDLDDSIAICNILGMEYDTINIQPIYEAFTLQYGLFVKGANDEDKDDRKASLINLAPRIRMTMLRLWGQTHHHRLCGTGNLSEITVGYCTKDGDTSCDFNPLGKLTSVEVVQMGETLKEMPKKYVLKTPEDGLSGMTDEEKLGVTYEDIHKYIRSIKMENDTWYKINELERKGIHKRTSGTPIYIPSDKVLFNV